MGGVGSFQEEISVHSVENQWRKEDPFSPLLLPPCLFPTKATLEKEDALGAHPSPKKRMTKKNFSMMYI